MAYDGLKWGMVYGWLNPGGGGATCEGIESSWVFCWLHLNPPGSDVPCPCLESFHQHATPRTLPHPFTHRILGHSGFSPTVPLTLPDPAFLLLAAIHHPSHSFMQNACAILCSVSVPHLPMALHVGLSPESMCNAMVRWCPSVSRLLSPVLLSACVCVCVSSL